MRTLREYGIYLLQQGIEPSMFSRMRVITYKSDMIDLGIVRCSICFADFKEGDRIKEYPKCKHNHHIKCLELWTSFEANCPDCLLDFPGLEEMLALQRHEQRIAAQEKLALEANQGPQLQSSYATLP